MKNYENLPDVVFVYWNYHPSFFIVQMACKIQLEYPVVLKK